MVKKFLWARKYNEEECKKSIITFYTLRATDDDIFATRDPCTPAAKLVYQNSYMFCLPGYTDDFYRVTFSALKDYDPDAFNIKEWLRRIFYMSDVRVKNDVCAGDIIVYDVKGFSMQHLMKFTLLTAKKFMLATEGALPLKIKQVHMLNCPTFIDKILSMFKQFMKPKLTSRIFVHQGFSELSKSVPLRMLPTEYGGEAGPIDQLAKNWEELVEDHREWFLEQDRITRAPFQEAKRAGKLCTDSSQMFGVEGSFKKLTID